MELPDVARRTPSRQPCDDDLVERRRTPRRFGRGGGGSPRARPAPATQPRLRRSRASSRRRARNRPPRRQAHRAIREWSRNVTGQVAWRPKRGARSATFARWSASSQLPASTEVPGRCRGGSRTLRRHRLAPPAPLPPPTPRSPAPDHRSRPRQRRDSCSRVRRHAHDRRARERARTARCHLCRRRSGHEAWVTIASASSSTAPDRSSMIHRLLSASRRPESNWKSSMNIRACSARTSAVAREAVARRRAPFHGRASRGPRPGAHATRPTRRDCRLGGAIRVALLARRRRRPARDGRRPAAPRGSAPSPRRRGARQTSWGRPRCGSRPGSTW